MKGRKPKKSERKNKGMIDIRNDQTKAVFTKKMDKLVRDAVLAVLEHEKISPMGVSV
jgi:hypothetical protein